MSQRLVKLRKDERFWVVCNPIARSHDILTVGKKYQVVAIRENYAQGNRGLRFNGLPKAPWFDSLAFSRCLPPT